MGNAAIEYHHVHKRFPGSGRDAVEDVSLRVEQGSIITILGTSGSGKTTLLKLANRIHDPTAGVVEYFGRNAQELGVVELRRKIGYVIQQAGLFPHRTVEENIATLPRILKWKRDRIDARVTELMQLIQLDTDLRKRSVRKLSGGQQQRVGLARALAVDPSVLLMDEPFGAIDALTREALQNELLSLQQRLGTTIIFVTHSVQEALKLGHRIVIMDQGEIQQADTAYNILLHPANTFVQRLLSTDDFFDKLRVLRVEQFLEVASDTELRQMPTILQDDSMSNALQKILQAKASHLVAVDEKGLPCGKVTQRSFQRILESTGTEKEAQEQYARLLGQAL